MSDKPKKITLKPDGFKAFAEAMGSKPAEPEKPAPTKPEKIIKRRRV